VPSSSDELGTALRVVAVATVLLALAIGGAWGNGHVSTREAHGALAGLLVADAVLATSALAVRFRGGLGA
jgi:hypothetical protein